MLTVDKNTLACLASLSALSVGPALAADDSARLEEIIVTASKRETNLMQTPLAITAFTQDFLDREGIRNARDLAGTAPNVQLGTGADSGTAATIRGVTSTDFTEVGEGAVAIHSDGFYSPRPQGTLALMYDIERVEILRGPQGTLFGMNSSGGTINIIPAKPDFNDSFAKVEAAFGNYGERQGRGMFNLAVNDKFALRAAFMVDMHDGMLTQGKDTTDIAYEAERHRARRHSRRRSAPQSRCRRQGLVQQRGPVGRSSHRPLGNDRLAGNDRHGLALLRPGRGRHRLHRLRTGGWHRQCLHARPAVREHQRAGQEGPDHRRLPAEARREPQRSHGARISRLVPGSAAPADRRRRRRHAPGRASGRRSASRRRHEAAETGYYPIWDESWNTRHSAYRTMTHELQFKSTGENRLQYVAGLYYLHENKSIRYDMEMLANKSFFEDEELPLGFQPDGLPDSWVFDQAKRTTTSKAAFAQLDYRIVDKVNLTLGYRYSDDEKTDHNGMTYAFWEGSPEWYNGEHTPTGIRAHQSNDLTNDMGSGAPLGTVMPASDPNNVKKSWSQGTYRIGAQYFANDDHMLFASLATGHKMGGMYEMADACNNGCPILLAYDPEEVKTYELGWKGTMLDGRVRVSATAFFSDYTDMQSTGDKVIGVDQDPESPNFGEPVTAWTTDNLSSSEIKGLELEFDLIPWSEGRLFGYVAWLDTSIKDPGTFQDGYACAERVIYGQPECGDPSVSDIRGNQLPFAPEYSATLNYEHRFALASGFSIVPFASLHWQSKMWFDTLNYDGAHLSQAQDCVCQGESQHAAECARGSLLRGAVRRQRDRRGHQELLRFQSRRRQGLLRPAAHLRPADGIFVLTPAG